MKHRIGFAVVVIFLWLSGIIFGTTSFPPQIVHTAKPIKKVWTNRDSRELAKTYASAGFGWQGVEWKCLNQLWSAESKWDFRADNPRSSAYGIAQLLGEKSRVPAIQILRGLRYISERYDTPCRAWRFHGHGWY